MQAQAGQRVTLTKMSWVDWTSERNLSLETRGRQSLRNIEACAQQGYDALLAESSANWHARWQTRRVQVTSSDISDQRALDYALYHLRVMTPDHDERSSIAAKGLTGEGYKGHIFWDTEVFLLPFHLFTEPKTARSLLRYRWHNLPGARESPP